MYKTRIGKSVKVKNDRKRNDFLGPDLTYRGNTESSISYCLCCGTKLVELPGMDVCTPYGWIACGGAAS